MRPSPIVAFLLGSLLTLSLAATLRSTPQDPQKPQEPNPAEMMAMMAKAQRYTQPGDHHKQLERFVGRWDTSTRMMMGGQATPASKGTAEFRWLMPGRWLCSESTGSLMGQKVQGFWLVGYDNFKMSYVMTMVNSMDTAMLRAEGDFLRDGSTLVTYGTLDEYLTGEHDKMVRYVLRFADADHFTLEVHDLHIGLENSMVVEVRFARQGG